MKQLGFDHEQYLQLQSSHIKQRIDSFGGKLYLEFGGKLFDDYHASRVLPGFQPDSKLRMLLKLKDQVEIVIAIHASDIEHNRVRGDLGITYDQDVLRLIHAFQDTGLYVGSVVITQYEGQSSADAFRHRLEQLGVSVYLHYPIEGYPSKVSVIVSEQGFGKNDYIETTRPLVVVTAPGPGSGKMATCLSQLYHEHQRSITAGYAKFETFPVWNLPLHHPVNLAYEAATADLKDVNMIDPFHLEAYGKQAVNYNRDVEVFPVLQAMFETIAGESPYASPTDMGVNMAGYCILDDEVCKQAASEEIIRRYYHERCEDRKGHGDRSAILQIELLMEQAHVTPADRKVAQVANELAEQTGGPAMALELPDGTLLTGKTTPLLGCSAAVLLNALKHLAGITHQMHLLSPIMIEPLQQLKVEHMGNRNPRLHTDEVLIALSICGNTSPTAEMALRQLPRLRGCEAHSSVILSEVDARILRKLGVNLTCEPAYENKRMDRH